MVSLSRPMMSFTWEDLINDPDIVATASRAKPLTPAVSPSVLEKVDDYTIQWTFNSLPRYLFYIMDEGDFNVSPAHIIAPLHPKNDSSMDYVALPMLALKTCPPSPWGPWVPSNTRPTSC
ncbi:MAG: hypothetical protein R2911_03850 [Caldilineaceae bacterium]